MWHRRISVIVAVITLFTASAVVQAQDDECANNGCVAVAVAHPLFGLSEAEILAYTEPTFDTLQVDSSLLYDRRYMRVTGALNIHDAPNGNVIRTLDEGFNFVTVINEQEGWTQINAGQWVLSESLTDMNDGISWFTGVFLSEEPLQYPIAWLLVNAYPSSEPGGPPRESNGLLFRYSRVNVFDTVTLGGWDWYQIGPGKWINQTSVAKVAPIDRPEEVDTERWIGIDLYEEVVIVYDGETPIFATLTSTGLPRWPTFEGLFHIYFRRPRKDMSWGTPGDDFYYLEEVPWTMFFDDGRALHGAYWHDGLGYRRSHGCVNLSITDARWLYDWVAEEFESYTSPDVEEGPAVYVYSSGEYR